MPVIRADVAELAGTRRKNRRGRGGETGDLKQP